MSNLYSVSVLTPAAAAGAPYATIHAPAGTKLGVKEIGLFCTAATASSIGIYRCNNTPVVTTNTLSVPHDPNDEAGEAGIGTAWSTAPTIGSNVALRRIVLPAAIGAGVIWQFDDLQVGVLGTGALVVWNFGAGAGSILAMYAVIDD